MSAEGATALYERVTSDEAFRAQLEAAETPEDKRRILTEGGYDVTRHDVPTFRKLAGMSELSAEELEEVAGVVGVDYDYDYGHPTHPTHPNHPNHPIHPSHP
jgi:predicted ribosomally synthesized peptide with nif11-like leader